METHQSSAVIVGACLRTLRLCDVGDIVESVEEMRSIDRLLSIAKRQHSSLDLVTAIVDVLSAWSTSPELLSLTLPIVVPFALLVIAKHPSERNLILSVSVYL